LAAETRARRIAKRLRRIICGPFQDRSGASYNRRGIMPYSHTPYQLGRHY